MIPRNSLREKILREYWLLRSSMTLDEVSKTTGIPRSSVWYHFAKFEREANQSPDNHKRTNMIVPLSPEEEKKARNRLMEGYLRKTYLFGEFMKIAKEKGFENAERLSSILNNLNDAGMIPTMEEQEAFNQSIAEGSLLESEIETSIKTAVERMEKGWMPYSNRLLRDVIAAWKGTENHNKNGPDEPAASDNIGKNESPTSQYGPEYTQAFLANFVEQNKRPDSQSREERNREFFDRISNMR
jgi:AcrR family transcriptional regulator